MYSYNPYYEKYLAHYGVLGMKWGVRKDKKRAKSNKTNTKKKPLIPLVNEGSTVARDILSGAKKGIRLASAVGSLALSVLGGMRLVSALKKMSEVPTPVLSTPLNKIFVEDIDVEKIFTETIDSGTKDIEVKSIEDSFKEITYNDGWGNTYK